MVTARFIDEVLSEILDKSLLSDGENHLYITKPALDRLLSDYQDEFKIEYEELGRRPCIDDLKDYLNVTILIKENLNGTEYELLTKI